MHDTGTMQHQLQAADNGGGGGSGGGGGDDVSFRLSVIVHVVHSS